MKSKILIVDDQADIRRLIRFALEGGGHTLFEAANGALALQIAKAIKPDLVILDQVMPGGLDGLQVLQALKADAELSHALVLMLTGNAEERDKQAALSAGANYFLTKPFAPAKLGDLITIMLKARPPQQ
ncbi:CheY-like chemotaxis protein [Inhella inkyongensis]|uniref:CheY-like chemotaxis protein n=1 Tax=Inhella inkyongensis TaxID=392593 RepID=A0A840S7Y4_9BURK|nr:response regulator [Inhella inkyongensis]MBB5205722.1 CheY-like chemotaxis protein [Inhella inkyongensis]